MVPRRIVDIQFRQIQQRLAEAGISLEATDEVLARSSACCSASSPNELSKTSSPAAWAKTLWRKPCSKTAL